MRASLIPGFLCLFLAGCMRNDTATAPSAPAARAAAHTEVALDPALAALVRSIRKAAASEPAWLGVDTRLRAVELLGPRHADLARPLLLDTAEIVEKHPEAAVHRQRILDQAARFAVDQSVTAGLAEPKTSDDEPAPPATAKPDYGKMPKLEVLAATRRERSPAHRLWAMVSLLGRADLTDDERGAVVDEAQKQLPRLEVDMASFQAFSRLFDQSGRLDDTPVFPELARTATRMVEWLKACTDPACQEPRHSLPAFYAGTASLVREADIEPTASDSSLEARLLLLDLASRLHREFDFSLRDIGGARHRLKDLRGKVVVLNFWATWCAPCRREMPDLDEIYRESKDRGLVVLAITDDDPDSVREFATKNRYSFPMIVDSARALFEQYRVPGYPSSVIIDREGGIAVVFLGARSRAGIMRALVRAGL